MNKRQRVFLLLFGIGIGYAIHDSAYDISQKFLKSIHLVSNKSMQQTVLGDSSGDQFITAVSYNGTQFSPRKARVRKGNYVLITNRSKTSLLWLQSDMLGVATTRGYAEGEQFQFTSDRIGSYSISNKLRPQSSFQLIVEE